MTHLIEEIKMSKEIEAQLKFQKMSLTDNMEALTGLFYKHYKEVYNYCDDIELSVDVAAYAQAEKEGKYFFFGVTLDDEIIGYCGFFVTYNIHYDKSLQARQDVVYLKEEFRKKGAGKAFIKYCDEQLKKLGVQVVYHHSKVYADIGHALLPLGYEEIEKLYCKRLDR